MSKEPDMPLTKSGIEAEMNRISREFIFDAAAGKGKNMDRLLEEMRRLVEHVKKNKENIVDDSSGG